jgi:hypothetical protein
VYEIANHLNPEVKNVAVEVVWENLRNLCSEVRISGPRQGERWLQIGKRGRTILQDPFPTPRFKIAHRREPIRAPEMVEKQVSDWVIWCVYG